MGTAVHRGSWALTHCGSRRFSPENPGAIRYRERMDRVIGSGLIVASMFLCGACGAKSALEIPPAPRLADASRDAPVPPDARAPDARDAAIADTRTADGDFPRPPRPCRSRSQPVDVVLVLDNSGSMVDEIAALAEGVPSLLRDMLQPPDRDGDGVADWAAVEDLHFAVTSTASGGSFLTVGDEERPECRRTYPTFHEFRRGDVDAFLLDASCVSSPRTAGSSGEALFSAALRGLLPSATSFPTGGLADTTNAGFLRDESLLVVIFLTDEEDSSPCFSGRDCTQHCVEAAGRIFCGPEVGSVAEYRSGFRLLRPTDEMVLSLIAGMPPGVTDPEEILRISLETTPVSSICRSGFRSGLAAPRMVELTLDFDGILHSICNETYTDLVAQVAERVGRTACSID